MGQFMERHSCRGVVIFLCLCHFVIFLILRMFARKRKLVSLQGQTWDQLAVRGRIHSHGLDRHLGQQQLHLCFSVVVNHKSSTMRCLQRVSRLLCAVAAELAG